MKVFITDSAAIIGDYQIPKEYLRELRRADPFITYGVLAVHAVVEKMKKKGLSEPLFSENCNLFLGSSYGPMGTNFKVLDQVVNNDQTSPTLFSHSVFNAAAGYLTRIFNLQGQALTITDFVLPFFQALQQAIYSISSGRQEKCLVLQVETYSKLLDDARSSYANNRCSEWDPGACSFLLSAEPVSDESTNIESFWLETLMPPDQTYLGSAEQLTINDTAVRLIQPLDAVVEIQRELDQTGKAKNVFEIVSPFARMKFATCRQ